MKKELKILLKAYETDASQITGKATEVIFPENINDLKQIVKTKDRICIRGGGSGLVGGAVPQNETVLDLSKLDNIGKIDRDRKTIEVEAGVILDELQKRISKFGLEFPVKPSSHSICTIGGMIATNAVGSRAIKYGKTSDWVNWIEVVDAEGNLKRKSQTEITDYAGMEGITGLITKASLKLISKKIRTASLIKKETIEEIHQSVLKNKRNRKVSMIEFIDKKISKLIGLSESYNLIIEYESDEGELKAEEYLNLLMKRDEIYPVLAQEGYTKIEDPKIMLNKFEQIISWCEKHEVPVFGHLSVGILHPCFKSIQENLIPELIKYVVKNSGKISGEHGIGLVKKGFIDINDRKILINIKKRTDKNGKFNRGKVI